MITVTIAPKTYFQLYEMQEQAANQYRPRKYANTPNDVIFSMLHTLRYC